MSTTYSVYLPNYSTKGVVKMSTTYSVYLPNYSVGPDCYNEIPAVTARYGKKVVLIGGKTALSKAQDAILEAQDMAKRLSSSAAKPR